MHKDSGIIFGADFSPVYQICRCSRMTQFINLTPGHLESTGLLYSNFAESVQRSQLFFLLWASISSARYQFFNESLSVNLVLSPDVRVINTCRNSHLSPQTNNRIDSLPTYNTFESRCYKPNWLLNT